MKILRVFPRKTNATPDDENVRIGGYPGLFDEADEIHISVAFTYDFPIAEKIAKQWEHVAMVKIGGPATGMKGEEFIPGMYLKNGYTITSRGCKNRCWFCSVWKREGDVRELPIKDGWNVLDDNLLACSETHIQKVFEMLRRQSRKACFTGGLEAKLLTEKRALELRSLKPDTMFFAYDTPDDYEPLREAGKKLFNAGFKKESHVLRCYNLIGFPGDTFEKALTRIKQTWEVGFMPMAMLWRDESGNYDLEWKRFQRQWANPVITAVNCKNFDKAV
jgi:hypothetical protein